MKSWACAVHRVTIYFCFSLPLFASDFPVWLNNGTEVTISLRLTPDAGTWQEVGTNAYSDGAYQLAFYESVVAGRSELKVVLARADKKAFTLETFEANWIIQDWDLFAIWSYNQNPATHKNYSALKSEPFGLTTSANFGIPYASAVTREGKNLLAVGALTQNRTLYLGGRPEEDGSYRLFLGTQLPLRTQNFSETLFTDRSWADWFDIARDYADRVDEELRYQPFPVSPACYYPMYDAWYWSLDNVSLDLYWKTLVQAKELGFQTYLFDAGWESENGELIKWLDGTLGNYSAPEDKLPRFADFLQRVKQSLQMNVVLWVAPYAMGRESVNYPAMKRAHTRFNYSKPAYRGGDESAPYTLPFSSKFAENVSLCPRTPATQRYMKSLFDRVSDSYHPDGYWLDFQDFVPFLCQATHKHASTFGGGFNISQNEIAESAIENLGRPTLELRYPVANLNNKRYANLWQSTDSPEDFDQMRLCNLIMRPFSKGVVMGTDEMYWSPSADETTAAKFIITTVFSGVPAIGADFRRAPRSHVELVKAWLKFYKDNQSDLTQGIFRPIGDFVFPDQKIESPDKAFIYLRSGNNSVLDIEGRPRFIYLANCTDDDFLTITLRGALEGSYQLQVLDSYLRPISSKKIQLGSETAISEAVRQGGLIQLTRLN
ncbi:MAG TPA: hypothetical protein VGQ81_11695 [Acidobacteriota bacterium]|nr:hypothetical protein [Acidobacteriota bacterium]